ncbi:MAG TPA: lysophospholipase [Legionellales bacterium]|nr:lysophospholipase [Legionellales bacterium]
MMMKYVVSLLMILLSLCSYSAAPVHINEVVVFGDSLSDNGNLYEYMDHQLPMSPPYYAGRFTNGPVWVELMLDKAYPLNAQSHLLDYAYGGAGIDVNEDNKTDDEDEGFSFHVQVKNYLSAHQNTASPNSLYVVWIGSNNYFNLPDNQDESVQAVVDGIYKNVVNLIKHGVKHLMILNVPNLSRIPAAIEYEAVNELGYMSLEHNRLLKIMIAQLQKDYPDVDFIDYDVTKVMDDIIDHPDHYGFTNATATCSDLEYGENVTQNRLISKSLFLSAINQKATTIDDTCDGYLFFDLYHPTEHAHVIIADELYNLLKEHHIVFN